MIRQDDQQQEAQRQQVEAFKHHQSIAEAQARQHQLQHQQLHQQQLQQSQQRQQQQLHQNNHSQQLQVTVPIQNTNKGRMPRAKGDSRPRGRMTAYAFFVQTCREEHKKKHPEENVVFAEFSKKCAERWKVRKYTYLTFRILSKNRFFLRLKLTFCTWLLLFLERKFLIVD